MNTCCFTGHRPQRFPWGNDRQDPGFIRFRQALAAEIKNVIEAGCRTFITGGALGVDTWAAELVLEFKAHHPDIMLELALPFEGYNKNASAANSALLSGIKKAADSVTVVSSGKRIKYAYLERDRYMVDKSDTLIAVYDDRARFSGGTRYTLEYARRKGLNIIQLNWLDYC